MQLALSRVAWIHFEWMVCSFWEPAVARHNLQCLTVKIMDFIARKCKRLRIGELVGSI